MSAPYTELEQPLEETALLCRGCLAESGEMKDMVEWGLTDDFYKFTEVQVCSSESLSQLLCTTCEDALTKCKDFRSQCWNSDALLRKISKMKKDDAKKKTSEEFAGEVVNRQDIVESEAEATPETTISCVMYDTQLVIMITAGNTDSKIHLSCPYSQCVQKFMKKTNLLHHLVKSHNINKKTFTIDLQYYCYHTNCVYHIDSRSNKWFSGRKFLNQHYNKVHKLKAFQCEICSQKFSTESAFKRHLKTCNMIYTCEVCNVSYNTNEKLLVHLMRRHPVFHRQYKDERKAKKRKAKIEVETKKVKMDEKLDCICDSPKRSFATQTLKPEANIKNDVTLSPWYSNATKSDRTDEISTQTVFEDLLSLKSQNSEDESLFFSENVSLSDIQTQTFPVEFGLSRSNKETITSETQSPDLSIKETQTCYCLYDSPKINYKLFDSVSSSPVSINLTSTQTQTTDKSPIKCDVLLSYNTIETQTNSEDLTYKNDNA